MLILASPSDVVQVVTGGAGLVDVHASWMDNVSGAVAPGRTNTAGIATATTTTVVPAPVADVQRNVKTLHIRNNGAAQTVGVQIVDATGTVKLWEQRLESGGTLQYIDEFGFTRTTAPVAPVVFQKFVPPNAAAATFTYTPTPGMLACIIEMVGGGGCGGDAAASPGNLLGGGGGGGGSYSRKYATAAEIGISKAIATGKGGTSIDGRTGGPGGDTWLGPSSANSTGALCLAHGGGGGGGTLNGDNTPVAGFGGPPGVGDITVQGESGEQGNYVLLIGGQVMGSGGRGGSSFFGGGAPIPIVGTSGSVPGIAGGNYGGGSSGAISNQTGGFIGKGPGSPGAVFITEFLGQ